MFNANTKTRMDPSSDNEYNKNEKKKDFNDNGFGEMFITV